MAVAATEWQCTQALTPGRARTRRWMPDSVEGFTPSQFACEKRSGTMQRDVNAPHCDPDAVT